MCKKSHLIEDLLLLVRVCELSQDLDVVEVLPAVVDGAQQQLRQVKLDCLSEPLAARSCDEGIKRIMYKASLQGTFRKYQNKTIPVWWSPLKPSTVKCNDSHIKPKT